MRSYSIVYGKDLSCVVKAANVVFAISKWQGMHPGRIIEEITSIVQMPTF